MAWCSFPSCQKSPGSVGTPGRLSDCALSLVTLFYRQPLAPFPCRLTLHPVHVDVTCPSCSNYEAQTDG